MRTIRQIADEADLGMGAYIDEDGAPDDILLDGHFSLQDLRDIVAAL
jgi:hypothetical protein